MMRDVAAYLLAAAVGVVGAVPSCGSWGSRVERGRAAMYCGALPLAGVAARAVGGHRIRRVLHILPMD